MKRLIPCAVLASLVWSNIALSHSVELENFARPDKPSRLFVLQQPPSPQADVTIASRASDRLAQAFDALADRETMSRSLVARGPADSIDHERTVDSSWRSHLADNTWPPFCAGEPYQPNPALPASAERRRAAWYPAMVTVACEAGLPTLLLDALVTQESRYNPSALSPKGAAGISQLMPDTARSLGVRNVWDPVDNMRGAARYMRLLLDEFGRFDLALAAYNAGEGRVRRKLEVPHIRETLGYVSAILLTMRKEIASRHMVVAALPQ